MRKLALALAGTAALSMGVPASASVIITFTSTSPIPGSNDFGGDLAGLGLTSFTTTGAMLTLAPGSSILFEFLGSESGFSDTFSTLGATPVSHTETSGFESHFGAPIVIGTDTFAGGPLVGLLNFTSSGGGPATVGMPGFGIFLPAGAVSGMSTNVFYLGYDDQITSPDDDNHDDFIVRATVLPEPGTWAMMLFGFGAVGYSMRKARRAKAIPQIA